MSLGFSFFKKKIVSKNFLSVLLYHEIDSDIFEEQIKYLKTNKYNILPLKTVIDKIVNKEKLPPKTVVLTFDDGLKNNYLLLDTIKRYKINPTIFIATSIVGTYRHFWDTKTDNQLDLIKFLNLSDKERLDKLQVRGFFENKEYSNRQALSMEEINDMKNYVDFQPHSKFHPVLTKCSDNKKISEIKDSKDFINNKIHNKVYAFAPPFGIYDKEIIEILKKLNFSCSLSITPGKNVEKYNLFELKRIGIPNKISINEFICRLDGTWDFLRNLSFIKNKSDFYNQYYES